MLLSLMLLLYYLLIKLAIYLLQELFIISIVENQWLNKVYFTHFLN